MPDAAEQLPLPSHNHMSPTTAPVYTLQNVWQSLHSQPCWPDMFHVAIDKQDMVCDPDFRRGNAPPHIRRLNATADQRGYCVCIETEVWSGNTRLTYLLNKPPHPSHRK